MFQDFEDRGSSALSHKRIEALRAVLRERDLTAFIVPRADEHQGEYVPASAERLAWLTGFTGSAGTAIVSLETVVLFVDGRYTLQAKDQVDGACVMPLDFPTNTPALWVEGHAGDGDRIGFDPWLHSVDTVKSLEKACAKVGAALVPATPNPLDQVWTDRPDPPACPVVVQPDALTGRSSAEKRKDLLATMEAAGATACVLTMPESICWLLNVRGSDVPHTPFVLSYAVIGADASVDWYVGAQSDLGRVDEAVIQHLGPDVRVHPKLALVDGLTALGRAGAGVMLDPATAPEAVRHLLVDAGATIVEERDPCSLPKACKTQAEADGIRSAHVRDGAALTRFLAWLATEAPNGGVTEIAATRQLEAFRRETNALKDLSFDTIAGSGPNGAIVHYRVTERTDRALAEGELFLVDSGGQYLDGTTDVTRTVVIGTPSPEMRHRFTLVLKGHINLAMARFPTGTTGAELDVLARFWLWQAGLNYDHGTGHGVGAYLSVHEGPQGIHRRATKVALEPGMVISNEPGYYKTGEYGIRIENLVIVTPPAPVAGGEREMLGFETLTLAPIDRALIDAPLLAAHERDWLNAYHVQVRETLTPLVDGATAAWLADATAPV